MVDGIEQMFIQPLMAHGAIEAFNVGVLSRLARLNEQQANTPLLGPGLKLSTAHLAAII